MPRFNRDAPLRQENGSSEWISNSNQSGDEANQRPPRQRRPPRREGSDRISGSDKTGVRAHPKKEGHGRGNWGTETSDATLEGDAIALEKLNVDGNAETVQNQRTGDDTTGDEENKVEEEVKIELTLEVNF